LLYNAHVSAETGGHAARPLRCTHCGRTVHETLHTRESWSVDYYLLTTGEGEMTTIAGDDAVAPISFLKLLTHEEVVTCQDCYRLPEIREQRELRFRPERGLEGVE
jgi:hypothetical protein